MAQNINEISVEDIMILHTEFGYDFVIENGKIVDVKCDEDTN